MSTDTLTPQPPAACATPNEHGFVLTPATPTYSLPLPAQAVEQMLSFLDRSPLEVVRAALAPYCRRAGLPLPDSPVEGVRLAVGMANCKGETRTKSK